MSRMTPFTKEPLLSSDIRENFANKNPIPIFIKTMIPFAFYVVATPTAFQIKLPY